MILLLLSYGKNGRQIDEVVANIAAAIRKLRAGNDTYLWLRLRASTLKRTRRAIVPVIHRRSIVAVEANPC